MSFVFTSLFLFALGAAVGSFINVFVYRSVRSETWVKGRSRCDFCKKTLKSFDKIPLLSFLFLRGKTHCCKKKLSLAHPVVEFISGTLFVWWYWGGSLFFQLTVQPLKILQPIFWLFVAIILLGIFVSDLLYMIIPDILLAILLVLAVVYRIILVSLGFMQIHDFLWMIFGAMLLTSLFAALFFITKGKGFGLGDVKFALPMGLLLAWPNILLGVFLSFIFGSIVGLLLLALKKKKFGQVIPFGPFLILGTVTALLFGDSLWSWYIGIL
ncbi:MAG: prepilin peptidase [Patescibacteria group bacterium]